MPVAQLLKNNREIQYQNDNHLLSTVITLVEVPLI